MTTQRFMDTDKNGRFQFNNLPRGQYRVWAALWTPTGAIDKDGRPVRRIGGRSELRVEAAKNDLGIVLTPER
jgi:hypothetical protein